MATKVVLRWVGDSANQKHPVEFKRGLPNGKHVTVLFKPEDNFETTLDKELKYINDFGKVIVAEANFPLSLLTAYGKDSKHKVLEFVKEFEESDFKANPLEKFKTDVKSETLQVQEDISKPKRGRPKHEEVQA